MRTPFRLRHRLARFLLAGAGTIAASPSAPADAATSRDDVAATDDCDDDCDDDAVQQAISSLVERAGETDAPHQLRALLADMSPFDATRTAALAALAPQPPVRRALAQALASRLRLVGDDLVLDQLATDRDAGVRDAAARALRVRQH